MRIAIFNVRYSPNLGDGLLSECLERELARTVSSIETIPLDLAGRVEYSSGSAGRQLKLQILERMPAALRSLVSRSALAVLTGLRLRPMWRRHLQTADAVIVGGGNLFADADLNFPMKIASALKEANRLRLPVAVYGVGVTGNWSTAGSRLFGRSLRAALLVDASVRDERSRVLWNTLMEPWGVPAASLAYDPGLLACDHYENVQGATAPSVIGFCITAPLAVRYHSVKDVETDHLEGWYKAAVSVLAAAGYHVRLFTNGSPEDRAFLEGRGAEWAARDENISIEPSFAEPANLAEFVSQCRLVIAHRMHACIAAYSFKVPPIGLAWDRKLNSFFELTERGGYVVDPARTSARQLVETVDQALEAGIDHEVHANLLQRCRDDVARLAEILSAAVAGS